MKATGIVVAVLSLICAIFAGIWFIHASDAKLAPWVCTAAISVLFYWWIAAVNPSWVRHSANAYAERLFESVEMLAVPRTKKEAKVVAER